MTHHPQRNRNGRFCSTRRSAQKRMETIESIGAVVMIVLLILGAGVLVAVAQCMEVY